VATRPAPSASTSADFSETECFAVAKAPSSAVTRPSGNSFDLGGSVTDGVVVTGGAAGGDPTGTVSFFVCGPMPTGTCDAGGTALGTATLLPDANGATSTSTGTSPALTPASPGRYCFRGEYSGDANYVPSSDSGANECFAVTTGPPQPPPPVAPAAVCGTLRINKKAVTVGARTTVRATVRNTNAGAMAGIRVIVRGAGVRTSGRTNTLGVARLVIRPRAAGVVRLRVVGSAQCVAKLVARGVFRPPTLAGRR
jgi:Bacterial Ig-like domain (group 3)